MTIFHKTIGAYAAAIGALDADAFAACFAADCELHDPAGTPPRLGLDGARSLIQQFAPLLDSVSLRPGKIELHGRTAAFTWAMDALGKNGKMASADGIDTMEFDEAGRIVRTHGYWNPGPFVAALTA